MRFRILFSRMGRWFVDFVGAGLPSDASYRYKRNILAFAVLGLLAKKLNIDLSQLDVYGVTVSPGNSQIITGFIGIALIYSFLMMSASLGRDITRHSVQEHWRRLERENEYNTPLPAEAYERHVPEFGGWLQELRNLNKDDNRRRLLQIDEVDPETTSIVRRLLRAGQKPFDPLVRERQESEVQAMRLFEEFLSQQFHGRIRDQQAYYNRVAKVGTPFVLFEYVIALAIGLLAVKELAFEAMQVTLLVLM